MIYSNFIKNLVIPIYISILGFICTYTHPDSNFLWYSAITLWIFSILMVVLAVQILLLDIQIKNLKDK